MKCINHLERDAQAVCNHCGKSFCADCLVITKGENYCKVCVALKLSQETKQERSPGLAAFLSFIIAGLGQIYNGQIGKGLLIFFTGWLVIPWVFGIFDAYSTAKKINQGEITVKSRPGCLIAFIVGVVALWIMVFIIGLLAAIAIPNLLRARLSANEAAVRSVLKNISVAVETYRAANNNYPLDESDLVSAEPPYLDRAHDQQTIYGYTFSISFQPDGYKAVATPVECGMTGSKIFSLDTTGVVSQENCSRGY